MDGRRLELHGGPAVEVPEREKILCESDRGKEKDGKETKRRDAIVLLVLVAGGGALADLAMGEIGGGYIRAVAGEEDGGGGMEIFCG